MPQFDVAFYCSQIFWLVVAFSFLYLLVHKFIVPLTEKILKSRETYIDTNIASAESLAAKADILHKQYAGQLEETSNIVENIKKEAKDAMETSFLSKKKQLHNELKVQIENNRHDIETINKSFWLDENDSCVNLAKLLIQRITNQPVDLELLKESYKKIK
ncbi:ATP F0F1 synthase subunit B' [Candidatus Tisiphia endosymbiont of Hybos culiciformis]|uniref:F0F1 ATP synthase subunit B family protein n=1 Tax=Candidatus Tisiphia endosymbiont of Hybos culiciformis TaxID=3139331 RepID=UPI003CCA7FFE